RMMPTRPLVSTRMVSCAMACLQVADGVAETAPLCNARPRTRGLAGAGLSARLRRRIEPLFLTNRTEEGRAPVLHDAANGAAAAASRAALPFPVVDPDIVLKHAEIAVGLLVVPQRRAAGRDGIVERRLDRIDERRRARVRRAVAQRQGRRLPP